MALPFLTLGFGGFLASWTFFRPLSALTVQMSMNLLNSFYMNECMIMFFSSTLTGEEHILCNNELGRQLSLEPRDQHEGNTFS